MTVEEKKWTYGERWRVCDPAAVFGCAISPITDYSKMTVLYLKASHAHCKDKAGRALAYNIKNKNH